MTTIEIIGALICLLFLWLEYKAHRWLWPVGAVTPLIYIYIFFFSKFYAMMGIQLYYLIASLYGWVCWKKKSTEEAELLIIQLPAPLFWKLSMIVAGLFVLIAWVLTMYTDSPVPYGDALTTALSIVAMWMLAKKYAEQWLFWLVSDTIAVGLYFWQGLYPTSALYMVYAVVSVFGYLKWKRHADDAEKMDFRG